MKYRAGQESSNHKIQNILFQTRKIDGYTSYVIKNGHTDLFSIKWDKTGHFPLPYSSVILDMSLYPLQWYTVTQRSGYCFFIILLLLAVVEGSVLLQRRFRLARRSAVLRHCSRAIAPNHRRGEWGEERGQRGDGQSRPFDDQAAAATRRREAEPLESDAAATHYHALLGRLHKAHRYTPYA